MYEYMEDFHIAGILRRILQELRYVRATFKSREVTDKREATGLNRMQIRQRFSR